MDRVLEIGGYAAGYAGRLFVQAGYEVVRVESATRTPGWVRDEALDLFLHPGKRRVAADSTGLIEQLADAADIVILEADSANSILEYRFDRWQTPVKVAITPFGRTGPKSNWRATPHVLLAMGGYTNLMGDPDRAPTGRIDSRTDVAVDVQPHHQQQQEGHRDVNEHHQREESTAE